MFSRGRASTGHCLVGLLVWCHECSWAENFTAKAASLSSIRNLTFSVVLAEEARLQVKAKAGLGLTGPYKKSYKSVLQVSKYA